MVGFAQLAIATRASSAVMMDFGFIVHFVHDRLIITIEHTVTADVST